MFQVGRDMSGTGPVPSNLERKQLRSLLTHSHSAIHRLHTHSSSHGLTGTHRHIYTFSGRSSKQQNPPNSHTTALFILKKNKTKLDCIKLKTTMKLKTQNVKRLVILGKVFATVTPTAYGFPGSGAWDAGPTGTSRKDEDRERRNLFGFAPSAQP